MYAITGITGQVGGHLARALLDAGQQVRAVVRDAKKAQAWADKGCEIALADIGDTAALTAAFTGVDGVFVLLPPTFDPTPGFTEARRTIAAIATALRAARVPRVVCLSTIGADAAQQNLLTQLQLLEQALATATSPVLVCLHHHPVPVSSDWLDRIGLDNAGDFFRIIDAHPSVRGIVWGHVHQQFDGLRRGVRLLATPSTCAQFLPHSQDFALDGRPPAFRTLELTADGSIVTDLHWVDPCGTGSSQSASSAA